MTALILRTLEELCRGQSTKIKVTFLPVSQHALIAGSLIFFLYLLFDFKNFS